MTGMHHKAFAASWACCASLAVAIVSVPCAAQQAGTPSGPAREARTLPVNAPPGPERVVASPPHGALGSARFPSHRQACQGIAGRAPDRLTLTDALEHVLCKSPAVRQALLGIQELQAGVELAQYAKRPHFSANAEYGTRFRQGGGEVRRGSSRDDSRVSGSLDLSWVLFDFGASDANVAQARLLLASSLAAQDTALLTAAGEALRAYLEAATAWARLDTLREAETVAGQSVQIARAKHDAQIAPLSERLQAQTALAQATLERVRAEGVWRTARGALAVATGYHVTEALTLADLSTAFPVNGELAPVPELLAQAREHYPRLRSLRFDIDAASARLHAVKAEGRGTIGVAASVNAARSLDASASGVGRSLEGAVVASFPIFNGSEQRARQSQVVAQIGKGEAALELAAREVENEIWRAAQLVTTELESLKAARQLLESADQAHRVALGRYKSGVGSVLELLSAQSALSNARSQITQAEIASASARIRLSLTTGRLGF